VPRRPPRISHTTVVAYLALFVALGGSAYAAATITGRDVVDRSLTGADIRNGTIRSPDVRSITGADLGPGEPWRLRSPDKRFSVSVTNAGITLDGPSSSVEVKGAGVTVEGNGTVEVKGAGPLRLSGTPLTLNGGCGLLADANKVLQHQHTATGQAGPTGPGFGPPPILSSTVLAC
jgi:hypothetical protein